MSFSVVLPKIDIKHKIWYVVQHLILTSRLKAKISHEVYWDLRRAAASRYCHKIQDVWCEKNQQNHSFELKVFI